MTRKIYRTAQGKMVDLGALQLQNENVRAVGNMGVNARGDLLDSANRPIDSRGKQVARQYNRQTTAQPASSQRKQSVNKTADIPPPPEDFQDDFVKEETQTTAAPTTSTPTPTTGGGLAAAIAKARQIKQEPMKTPRELAQEKSGVNKI